MTGQSTQQHIHDKLIERAKEKLSTTDLSVTAPDQHYLSLMTQDPRLEPLHHHAQQFITLVNTRKSQLLDDWLQTGLNSPFSSYQYFVKSFNKDYDAVKAALDLSWSNGPTEGYINKL